MKQLVAADNDEIPGGRTGVRGTSDMRCISTQGKEEFSNEGMVVSEGCIACFKKL